LANVEKLRSDVCIEHGKVCERVDAIKEIIEIRFTTIDSGIRIIRDSLEKRLEVTDHIRRQLEGHTALFMPRSEIELLFKGLVDKIGGVEKTIGGLERNIAHSSGKKVWSDHIITVIIGFVVVLIVWLVTAK
jgi:hypothetical protein